jgi:teichuronic acid biosynthesis glycosyltransferase TuaH
MIRNKDIVVVGLNPWHSEIASNCRNIAIEFAKHNRVLYVNHPLDRASLSASKNSGHYKNHFEIISKKKENLFQVEKNIWTLYPKTILESANWIPYTSIFRIINKINNRRFAADIKKGIDRLNFKNFILFNDNDIFRSFHLKELLKPVQYIYYTRDHLLGVRYWQRHGKYLEPELFSKSDLVVANSDYLTDCAKKYNRHSFYIGQGCDTSAFDSDKVKEIPLEVASIASPVIGYIGSLLTLRLDIDLLQKIALNKKEWNFVFIGHEDETFKNSSLHQLPNVYFLGAKKIKELPAYLARFDVAINPQKVNAVTIGNYPRKIDEYLAMGKAVVATETAAMSIFKDYVYFASTAEEYIKQIETALSEDSAEKRRKRIGFSKSHSWESSVEEIYKAMLTVNPDLMPGAKKIVLNPTNLSEG